MSRFARLLADESGATFAEYALIASALSVVMIGALAAIAAECSTRLSATSANMAALGVTPP
ncbi:MAG TPA: Flp family type IVb pilin [Candidatus Elarobacter sp.]|nr:Flp family type IVb pilin [Candidatus Elarobacter sp.]